MDEGALFARAQQERSRGDLRAAILDLKNLLRKHPANVEARLALGELTLQSGDIDTAIQELEMARERGVSAERVSKPLARAYLARRRPQDALQQLDAPRTDMAGLQTLQGTALLQLGRSAEARQKFEAALQSDAKDIDALLGLATVVADLDGIPAGLTVTERALQTAPGDPRVRILRGRLQLRAQAPALAQKEFEEAVRDAEHNKQGDQRFTALIGHAQAALAQSLVEESLAVTARVQQIAPEDPVSRLLRAQALLLAGKPAEAQPLLEKNVSADSGATDSKFLLGLIALNNGLFGQAEMYLASVVTAAPTNLQARKLLAEARLRQRKPADALNALLPAVEGGAPNAQLLAAAGKVSFAAGRPAAALEYLERSVKADPDNSAIRLDLAAGYVANGQADRAIALLDSAPVDEANTSHYRYLKALTFLARGDRQGAVNFATGIAAKESTDADAQTLAGSLLASQKDFGRAGTYFERAATLSPRSPAPHVSLGRLEWAQGHYEPARAQFARALELSPGDATATLSLVELELGQRRPEAALAVLDGALKTHPKFVEARILQARILAGTGKLEQADAAAREAVRMAPENTAAIELLARVALARGKLDEANARVADLTRLAPDQAGTQMLVGNVQLAQKRYAAAAAAYRKAGTSRPDTAAALAEFRARRLGALDDPLAPLLRLVEQRPNDTRAQMVLAQAQQELGDAPAAIRSYEGILARNPNDAPALNNLAWLRYQARDPGALALAKRAHAAAPGDPRITDTYGWLLVENGQLQEGLELLAAIAGPGADEEVRMHYAQALARAGKKDEARALGARLVTSSSARVSDAARRFVAELDRG